MMKGTVMFASLLKRDSRAHTPNIEPKPMSTFPQKRDPRGCFLGHNRMGLSRGSQTLGHNVFRSQ